MSTASVSFKHELQTSTSNFNNKLQIKTSISYLTFTLQLEFFFINEEKHPYILFSSITSITYYYLFVKNHDDNISWSSHQYFLKCNDLKNNFFLSLNAIKFKTIDMYKVLWCLSVFGCSEDKNWFLELNNIGEHILQFFI